MQRIKQFLLIKLLKLLKPFQVLMQRMGRSEPKMNRESVDLALSLVKPGDILLSHENQRITSYFIKGFYDHAAILGPNGKVIEAVGDKYENGVNVGGVRHVDLEEWLFLMDSVAIVRPITMGDANYVAGCNALSYVGLGYDYEFKIDKSKIYCSELVYLCYRSETDIFKFSGQILPQVYRDMVDDEKLKLVYEFK